MDTPKSGYRIVKSTLDSATLMRINAECRIIGDDTSSLTVIPLSESIVGVLENIQGVTKLDPMFE